MVNLSTLRSKPDVRGSLRKPRRSLYGLQQDYQPFVTFGTSDPAVFLTLPRLWLCFQLNWTCQHQLSVSAVVQIKAHPHPISLSTPKGVVQSVVLSISNVTFRHGISSTCQTAVSEITAVCGQSYLFAEVVVAVGSVDLVVGELDR